MRTNVCIVIPTGVPGTGILPASPAAMKSAINAVVLKTLICAKKSVQYALNFVEVNNVISLSIMGGVYKIYGCTIQIKNDKNLREISK